MECFLSVLYDSCWPIFLWLSPLLFLLSLLEWLALSDIGYSPLQRPIPPWPWETSCGFSLPRDPPWSVPLRVKRKQHQYSFIQREQRRVGNVQSWKRHYQDSILESLPWGEDTISNPLKLSFNPSLADWQIRDVLGTIRTIRTKGYLVQNSPVRTIFVDHASSFMYLVNQTSLRAGETLQAKIGFECFAPTCGRKIRGFRADNMPFDSKEFKVDLVS
jgi:hypothetical protein